MQIFDILVQFCIDLTYSSSMNLIFRNAVIHFYIYIVLKSRQKFLMNCQKKLYLKIYFQFFFVQKTQKNISNFVVLINKPFKILNSFSLLGYYKKNLKFFKNF